MIGYNIYPLLIDLWRSWVGSGFLFRFTIHTNGIPDWNWGIS